MIWDEDDIQAFGSIMNTFTHLIQARDDYPLNHFSSEKVWQTSKELNW